MNYGTPKCHATCWEFKVICWNQIDITELVGSTFAVMEELSIAVSNPSNKQKYQLPEGIFSVLKNIVISQYPQGIGSRTLSDTKMCGYSSPLYKMV